MKRTIKNFIMIIILLALGLHTYFIMTTENKEVNYNMEEINEIRNDPGNMTMPQNPNGTEGNMPPLEEMAPDGTRPEEMTPREMQEDMSENRKQMNLNTSNLNTFPIVLLENIGISIIIIYMLMSKFNKLTIKETLKNSDKVVILLLATIILATIISVSQNLLLSNKKITNGNESTTKETTAKDVDSGSKISTNDINLNDYNSNININKGGEYIITGEFNYSIIIDTTEKVTLNLDNVTINSNITAAIANINTGELIINLLEDTTNTLKDNGSSEYDGCIYSKGKLTIEGSGTLKVYGNQEEGEGIATETNDITINSGNIYIESADDGLNAGGDGGTITINDGIVFIKASGDGIDSNGKLIINGGTIYSIGSSIGGDAGIDTDGGYDINGGLIIALGSDMLTPPTNTSNQKTICFNLNEKITSGTLITLINENGDVIVSFEAKEDFKTLIISSKDLKNGTYYLYKDGKNTGKENNGIYTNGEYTKGEKITINKNNSFKISSTITTIN